MGTFAKTRGPEHVGSLQWCAGTFTFSNSYTTGGEALAVTDFGFDTNSQILKVESANALGFGYSYDYTNNKLKAWASLDGSLPITFAPGGGDIKGGTAITAAMATADQATEVANAELYFADQTFTTLNGAVGAFGTPAVQPAVARNVVIQIENDTGGSLNLYTGTMNFAVVGTFRGAAQTETIPLTLTGGQVALANTPKYRAVGGVKPFDTITSITVDATSLASIIIASGALKVSAGPGTLFGLPYNSKTGANADVIEFSVNAAPRAVAGNLDFTNKTFNTGTIADGDDIAIVYNADLVQAGGTALGNAVPLAEVPSTTDLSTISVRVMAWAAR